MAISGKSSSMAALLLMVAVLAGAANAQVNVSNRCNQTIVLSTAVANLTIAPRSTITFPGTAQNLLQEPVILGIPGGLPVPEVTPIVPVLIATLLSSLPVGPIPTITIECSPPNYITITVSANIPMIPGGLVTVPFLSSIVPVCPALPLP